MNSTEWRTESSPVATRPPRFGGFFLRLSRVTGGLAKPLAGKAWIPAFALVEHRGRRSGQPYSTPVAARRTDRGFVVALAFGAQVDWYRNLVASGGGTLRWRGASYRVGPPRSIAADRALSAFNAVQRFAMRAGGIDGYIVLEDVRTPST